MSWITIGADARKQDHDAAVAAIAALDPAKSPYFGIVLYAPPRTFGLAEFSNAKDAATWYRDTIAGADVDFAAYYQTGVKEPFDFFKGGAYANDLSLAPRRQGGSSSSSMKTGLIAAAVGLIVGWVVKGRKGRKS